MLPIRKASCINSSIVYTKTLANILSPQIEPIIFPCMVNKLGPLPFVYLAYDNAESESN